VGKLFLFIRVFQLRNNVPEALHNSLLIEKPAVVFIGGARENQLPISFRVNSRQFAGKLPLFSRVISHTELQPAGIAEESLFLIVSTDF
jgi:hypothetical protein